MISGNQAIPCVEIPLMTYGLPFSSTTRLFVVDKRETPIVSIELSFPAGCSFLEVSAFSFSFEHPARIHKAAMLSTHSFAKNLFLYYLSLPF